MLAVAAWLTLTKFSYLMVFAVIVGLHAVSHVVRRQRVPWIVPVFMTEVLLFWLMAGQQLPDYFAWLHNAVELVDGYSAMACSGPAWQIVLYWITIGCALVAVGRHQWKLQGSNSIPLTLTYAAIALYVSKSAFLRHDEWHYPLAASFALATCLSVILEVWKPSGAVLRGLAGAALFGAVILAVPAAFSESEKASWSDPLANAVSKRFANVSAIGGLAVGSWSPVPEFDDNDREIREMCPIPTGVGAGGMDTYSYMQCILFAHRAKYNPRPVIQSYTAYTPRLALLNAAHIRGSRKPDQILFSISPIDARYPSLDDSLSWPDLWARYEPDDDFVPYSAVEYVSLRRSATPRPVRFEVIRETEFVLDSAYQVPGVEDGPVWVELEFQSTLAGRAAAAALKAPAVSIDVEASSGEKGTFKLLPKLTQAGFLLSPIVTDSSWFGWVASTHWDNPAWQQALPQHEIRTVTIRSEGNWAWKAKVRARFSRVIFEPAPSVAASFRREHLGLCEMQRTRLRHCSPRLRWLNGEGAALIAPGGTCLGIPVSSRNPFMQLPTTTRQLRIRFGGIRLPLSHGLSTSIPASGKIEFRISVLSSPGREHLIWSKTVDSACGDGTTTAFEDAVPVDLDDSELLAFETVQEHPDQTLVPCWFGVAVD